MATIGLIGAGKIGGTVARLAVNAGYEVVLSNSREPRTLTPLLEELGAHATAATPPLAAGAADLVVVSIPLEAYRNVPVVPLAGKVVVDTANYYPARDGHIAELDRDEISSSELLQRHLPESHVVKCFNSIFYKHLSALARPSGAPDRSALPIAGDDAAAKSSVTGFLDAIGYDAVDAGPLAEGRRFQPGTALYGAIYAGGDPNFVASPGVPVSAEAVRAAL